MSDAPAAPLGLEPLDWVALLAAALLCLALLAVDLVRHGAGWTVGGE